MVEVVVPSTQRQRRVAKSELADISSRRWTSAELTWRAAATRSLALAADGSPISLARGGVTLLPHQLVTLERALAMDPVRLAICDEVGLGKTITAGAILAELKARGRIHRIAVVAPKGVQLQWIAEMSERFDEEFVRVGPEGLPVDSGIDPWRAFDQVVCSIDAVKPLRRRAGWSPEQVDEHNAARFRALVDAGWDLVIIDEAHHVAGSNEDVARHRLAVELAAVAPNVLLRTLERFAALNPTRAILTKLDEALSIGPLFAAVSPMLPKLSYITTGQEVPDDFAPANANRLARWVLDGLPTSVRGPSDERENASTPAARSAAYAI
jgi:SNF2 family DNA or RNA helicase